MTITANIANELATKAKAEKEAYCLSMAEAIIRDHIEPIIRQEAEDGRFSTRVKLTKIEGAWRYADLIAAQINEAGFKANVIADTHELSIIWR